MKKVTILLSGLLLSAGLFAQEIEKTPMEELQERTESLQSSVKALQKFKVSGYIQTQYQYGERDASLKVGASRNEKEKSDSTGYDRIGIRRGRIKFTYDEGIASGVFQLDITEKGVSVKDAYLLVKDPWIESCSFKAGIFDRPFGNEISYSSSRRESPERSTIFQTLFPEERDLGAMLTLQAPKTSPFNFLKLEAGLFAGNGIKTETDSRRDFIGHLSANKSIGSDIKISGGVSYYNGSVYQQTNKVYTMEDVRFIADTSKENLGGFAKREYVGLDLQFSAVSILGMTQLRAEYLMGQQPAIAGDSKSPNYASIPASGDTYIRNFNGGYVIFIQDIGTFPLSLVLKYDWYNPNTKVSGDEIGKSGSNTGKTDLSVNTFGFGCLWRMNNNLRLQAYYEINGIEKSEFVNASQDYKANVFTLRLQYKF